MTNTSNTRLGNILLKKQLLTPEQLNIAIAEQTKRRLLLNTLDTKSHVDTSLGEILIELGFIDRLQLNRGLNWQMVVRNMTLAMSLCAPLLSISGQATAQSLTSASSSTRSYSLPLTIQAENYSAMKGISTASTTDVGGGSYVGWIETNDWLVYGNTPIYIPTTGSYKITYRVASLEGGGKFSLREANANFTHDVVVVPKTSGWQNWVDIQRTITLNAGVHIFSIKANASGFNINWFKIESAVSVASSSVSSIAASSKPASSLAASSRPASSTPASSTPLSSIAASSKPASSVAASLVPQSSVPASSRPASSQAASSKPASSSSSTSSLISTQVSGPVEMSWIPPNLREDGTVLDITQLGGYELRYKLLSDADFTYISINDPWTNFYNFSWLEGNYIFQIAAFDKDGLYSDFVNVLQN
ncbi:MAG: carbohydrate-binding protein [Pseudomonadota bacterium]